MVAGTPLILNIFAALFVGAKTESVRLFLFLLTSKSPDIISTPTLSIFSVILLNKAVFPEPALPISACTVLFSAIWFEILPVVKFIPARSKIIETVLKAFS